MQAVAELGVVPQVPRRLAAAYHDPAHVPCFTPHSEAVADVTDQLRHAFGRRIHLRLPARQRDARLGFRPMTQHRP